MKLRLRALAVRLVSLLLLLVLAHAAQARAPEAFLAKLSSEERQQFETWFAARVHFNHQLDSYWRAVNDKRAVRRRKRGTVASFTLDDYVMTFPPSYTGPELAAPLAKRWADYQAKEEAKGPPPQPKPGLEDFLAHAKAQYRFVPERIPEREFKRRYAKEALAAGLTKDQVVRIYSLETSGLGTADMVAGIHPIRKTGTPISTAIGYAQLLAANTINEIAKSGPKFIERLRHLAREEPQRADAIAAKIDALRSMYATSKSVPDDWGRQTALAATPRGLGMHAINLDADIGPWLQVIKIKGLKTTAERKGVNNLTGAEIELMNLAGPMTGLEMMQPAGRQAPTPNFFERNAYGRNTIVRGKTGEQLLLALDERMNENMNNSGAVEFAAVFDELMGLAPAPAPRSARDESGVPQPFGKQ
jgi:hypothetical protein